MTTWIPLAIHFLFVLHHGSCEENTNTKITHLKDTYFSEDKWYKYTYSSTVDSSFVGTSPSKSGFKYTCEVKLGVYPKFKSVLKVNDCRVYNRLDGSEGQYIELLSTQFTSDVSRYSLYFTFDKNVINISSIQVHKDDPVYSVNIKRSILSSLQVEILGSNEKHKSHEQMGIFGRCPVDYDVHDHASNTIFTRRDLTLCKLPQIFRLQMRLFSIIEKIHGGYKETETLEPVYPFSSVVDCQYKISNMEIKSADCLQSQVFKPTGYNGSIYATAITNIRQSFNLVSVSAMSNGDNIEISPNLKNAHIMFEYLEEVKAIVSRNTVQDQLYALVKSYNDLDLQSWPELYQDFVWFMKHSTEDNLQLIIKDILDCHGNTEDSCDQDKKMLEIEYFVDGLLSCATDACITVFTKCVQEQHVSWFTSGYFLYDLALNHEPNEESVRLVLDICKKSDTRSCWFPLSIMVSKLYMSEEGSKEKDGAIYQVISTLSEALQAALQKEGGIDTDVTLRVLKALANMGIAVQDVYDTDGKLTGIILDLKDNSQVPDKVVKSAIQVVKGMRMTTKIKEKLLSVISDINRPSSIRTSAFSVLFTSSDEEDIHKIINLIHTEQMNYMQTYMVSYVEGLLENDQPNKERLRTAWQAALRADGRPLPEIENYLYGKSRYMEMSRYFKLPFSLTHYGLQLEFDLVFDPASPFVQSAVLRVNYYKDKKYNLIELTADVRGLEEILDAILEAKGKGLYSLLSLFAKAKRNLEKGVNPQFADFDKHLSDAINRIIKMVNYPQFVLPDEMLTFKLYGYEVMYVDMGEIFTMLMKHQVVSSRSPVKQQPPSTRRRQQGGFMSSIMMMISRGYRLIKTRSAKVVELSKVIPTLSGAPLNMTVLLTASMGLEVTAKADLSQYMRGTRPVQAKGGMSLGFAGEFFGQMTVNLENITSAGCRMLASMNAKGNLETSATLVKGSTSSTTLANYTAHFKRKNIDGQYKIAQIRSHLYHLHKDWTELTANNSVQTTVKKCTGPIMMLITGNTACMEMSYADVTESKTHAYFPLSGPFTVDVDVSMADKNMKEFNLEVDYLITNDSSGPMKQMDFKYSAPGKKLKRRVNVNVKQSMISDGTTAIVDMPELGIHLDILNQDLKHVDTAMKQIRSSYRKDFHVQMKSLTLFRAKLQMERNITEETVFDHKEGKDVTGNKTQMKATFVFAAPHISLDVNFENLKEKLGSHMNTDFYLKYYCSRHHPMMYLLHLHPKLAAANNDISEIKVVNNAVVGYVNEGNKLWSADDSLHISYPGQKFSLSNSMSSNATNAHRKTVIKYIGPENKEETIEMNAHVENQTVQSSNYYCYHMTLEHKGKYDIHLKGHLYGNVKRKLSLQTDIHFQQKKLQKESNIVVNGNTKDLTISDNPGDKECTIYELEEWTIKINLTVQAKPIFAPGQQRPKGAEFVWDFDMSYPDCDAEAKIESDGAIGRHLLNTPVNFRYWYRSLVNFTSQRQTKPRIYDISLNVEYLKRHYFDHHFAYDGPSLNTSYDIRSDRFPNNTGIIVVKCHSESAWAFTNFDYSEHYAIAYKGPGIEITSVNHSLDTTWAYFNMKLDSEVTKNNFTLSINQNGYIDVRYPIFHGLTNISTQAILSKTSRSGANIKLTRNKTEHYIDVALKGPKAIEMKFSLKKPRRPKLFVISWLSELVGSTSRQSTIEWNPNFTRKGLAFLIAKKNQLSKALSTASVTLTKNLEKDISSMVLPFSDKTVGYVVSKLATPVMNYLPLPSNIKTMIALKLHPGINGVSQNSAENGDDTNESIQNDDQRKVNSVQTVVGFITKCESRMLAFLSNILNDQQPLLVNKLARQYLRPLLYQIKKTNKISFTQPLLCKWKHFMALPSLTIGQKYILGNIKSRYGKQADKNNVQTALLYDNSEILTFDGKLYQMEDSRTCSYLLAADVEHGNFAVVSSTEGITVLTKTSMTTVHKGGQVFIDRCNQPVNLPYKTEELHIVKKNGSRVITLDYGLTVSCDINNYHCNFGLKNHYNKTIGLLGNNDREIGNDFKSTTDSINPSAGSHISNYELADAQYCRPSVGNMLSQVKACDDLQQKCQDFFSGPGSPLSKCFLKVDPVSFSNSCEERVKNCMLISLCPSVHAYISKCDIAGITIEPSEKLDMCKESYLSDGEIPSKALLDIVIVLYKEDNNDFCVPCIETLIKFLQTCDKTDVKLTFTQYDSLELSLNEVLTKSTQHPFRLHTQKVVTVIKADKDLSEKEYNTLKDLYVEKNIILNIISKYNILKYKGLVGLNWDHRIISFSAILDETRELPQDFSIKLMSQTKGALFNAMLLEKNRKTRMEELVKHICERQAYSNTNC